MIAWVYLLTKPQISGGGEANTWIYFINYVSYIEKKKRKEKIKQRLKLFYSSKLTGVKKLHPFIDLMFSSDLH